MYRSTANSLEMTEKLIDRLVKFGFTLYEARVYVSLISIRVGSARDIQELTGIPRGRVYDVLESLVQKGYAGVTKGTPTLYSATDVQETFDRLKIDHSRMCDSLAADLIKIEQKVTAKTLTFQSYELHTEWALENQIQSLFRRCRSEMVVLSTNPQTIQKYETDLKKLAKRVQLYVIVDDPARFTGVSLKLYTGDQDIDTIFLGTKAPDGITDRVPDLMIFSDEKETLSVVRSGDAIGGIMVTNGIFGKYFQKSILRHLNPV